MIATVWRFRVADGHVGEFERAYGPNGDWAVLFARADGYAGTELLKLADHAGTYVTIDRWRNESDFHQAKAALKEDYDALDRRCAAYTCEETWLGLYTVKE